MKSNVPRSRSTSPPAATSTSSGAPVAAAEPKNGAGKQEAGMVLSILPIKSAVLFPGMMVPLTIGRKASRRLIEDANKKSKMIGVFTQKTDTDAEPGMADLHEIGVSAKILRVVRGDGKDDSNYVAVVSIEERVRLVKAGAPVPWLRGTVENLTSIYPPNDNEWKATVATMRDTALSLLAHKEEIPEQVGVVLRNIEDSGRLADFIAGGIEISPGERQVILEQLDVAARVRNVSLKVGAQLEIAQIQDKIQKDVQSQFGDMQRRAWLNEQLKAIQKELGNEPSEEGDTFSRLKEKLAAINLPKEARTQTDRELKRLEHIPPGSPEHGVILGYLETVAALPWDTTTTDNLDLAHARKILDEDHFGLDKIKRRLVEYLAVRKLKPDGRSPILLLVGPPGVGKTSLGQSVARALGRKFSRVSLGGVRDEADIRGHRRTYIGAMPGRLISELRRSGTRNPVILLDELDKLGNDFRGDPASALLEVLDPAQNHTFTDHYLDVPFDLSQVLFIGTANSLDTIPGPLRDRLEILELSSYTTTEKKAIATKYLLPRQKKENGLKPRQLTLRPGALDFVISDYTREAGVRELERLLGSLCRSVAARLAAEEVAGGTIIDKAQVEEILGPPRYLHDEKLNKPQTGVVTGLAWTSVGGDVLHIEALRFTGKGNIQLTGQLGDVMKESVQTAMSLVRSRADSLGIPVPSFAENDVHVHVPAGAVPKDGPSAGVGMFTALVSLHTGRPVRSDVAMTGEISLRGQVLPIGGLKEKTLAAMRAGITKIVIPEANRRDLPDIPPEVKKAVELVFVKTVDDVLREALVP